MKYTVLFLLFLISSNQSLFAQDFEAIRKQYPDEKAVLLNRLYQYNISLKDGQPYIESHESQQIAYLSGSAASYMSEYGFSHSDFQKLISYEAYTRTPDDKKLKVSEFKTSTNKESFVFYDDVKFTSFNFPSIEAGAVGNLEVSWQNTDPHLLSPYFFSGYMPNLNSELQLTVDKNIQLKYKLMGLDTNNILVTITSKSKNNIYTFQYKNCPADKKYGDAPGFSWYSPHVIFYIENYKDETGNKKTYLSNLKDLYNLNYSYIKAMENKPKPELKHIVDSLIKDITSPEEKAKRIYTWVQHNIKYVAFENGMEGFVPRDAALVCNRRYGDCKDMASILTEMLNTAGVPAYFTWIGTRDLPYSFSNEPLPMVSNHMICTINLNGQYVFLDGTDPTCVFGLTPSGIQDKEAMVAINEHEYKLLKVPVIDKSKNTIVDSTWLELTPTGLKGKIKRTMRGYQAMSFYGDLMYWSKKNLDESMKREFERGSNKFKLDTFYIGKDPSNNEITVFADFELPNYSKKVGNDYYLNLNLFKFYQNEHIDYPKRKVPIENNYLFQKKYVTLLKLPDGYKVSYLPQGKSFHNKLWGFDMRYEQNKDNVTLTQEFENNSLMLTYADFEQWNKVLENLFPLYKETLSLSKN